LKFTGYLLEGILDFIYPPRCLVCKKLIENNLGLCEDCFKEIKIIENPYCQKCGMPLEPAEVFRTAETPLCVDCRGHRRIFVFARAIGRYEGVLRECIHLLKYKGKKVILRAVDRLIENYFEGLFPVEKISFVVPVPLHKKRLRERGFNQAELIAKLISSRYGISLLSDVLQKVVYTSAQVTLNREERIKNVKDAFAVANNNWIYKSTVLLVDDVYTTGATIVECARVLKNAGAREVYAFTLAHDVLPH